MYAIIPMLPPPNSGDRKEVPSLEIITSFLVAVAAGVVCHYIIKWLDGDK